MAGQGTDVAVYPRATSDWLSLALAQPAQPSQHRMGPERIEEREVGEATEEEKKKVDRCSVYPQGTQASEPISFQSAPCSTEAPETHLAPTNCCATIGKYFNK